MRIFYINDFDPAGRSMPLSVARKLEYLLRHHHRNRTVVKLCPLMLTGSQCVNYHLPRIPIRKDDSRRRHFENCHGPGAMELDALAGLYPGAIARVLGKALGAYCSEELAAQIRAEAQDMVSKISQRISEQTNNWIPVLGKCSELQQVRPAKVSDGWLYDSTRDYLGQLAVYHKYLNANTGSDEAGSPRPKHEQLESPLSEK